MKTGIGLVIALIAAGFFLESWFMGYLPGDPDGIAARMRDVMSLSCVCGGLALASLLPIGPGRWILLALSSLALVLTILYRLEILSGPLFSQFASASS